MSALAIRWCAARKSHSYKRYSPNSCSPLKFEVDKSLKIAIGA
jgi:hypothetical protein